MGLAERRAAGEFQSNVFPGLKSQIDAAAGFEVPMEIDWQALAQPNYAHLYDEFWTKIFFEPLIAAFRVVCADDFGKQALKEGLKKVWIVNTRENYDRAAFTFEGGVLKIDHELVNADRLRLRTDTVVSLLQQRL